MQSAALAQRLRERIVSLARVAGPKGITINEAERQIQDHKGHSVSPRFVGLVNSGVLVRVFVGYGAPTKRFPKGAPRYRTRHDEETRRNVTIHWLPEFAPAALQNDSAPGRHSLEKRKPEAVRMELRRRAGECV